MNNKIKAYEKPSLVQFESIYELVIYGGVDTKSVREKMKEGKSLV